MFFWFIGTSIATIWFVFHDKKFAYRLVVAGALVPDAIEVFLGHAGPLHSLVTIVAIMAVVMLFTYGRKKSRSKMLAFVIGMFLHLVFVNAPSNTKCRNIPITTASILLRDFLRPYVINMTAAMMATMVTTLCNGPAWPKNTSITSGASAPATTKRNANFLSWNTNQMVAMDVPINQKNMTS